MTSTMVFTTVFGIHYNFFIALPIYLFAIFIDFFYKPRLARPKDRAHLKGFSPERIGIERAICPDMVQLKSLKFQSLLFY